MEELELDLVDFETAVDLAERGCYLKSKKFFLKDSKEIKELYDNMKLYLVNKTMFVEIYQAPLLMTNKAYLEVYTQPELELVSKWLMERKDINITICLLRKEFNSTWYFNIDNIKVDKIIHRWHPKEPTYAKYELALLEAIKFSLTLIPKII